MKKSLAILLTVLMLLSVAPFGAMSDVLPKLDLDFDFAVTAHATGDTPYLTSGFCGDTSDGGDGTNIAWSLDADGTLTLTGTGKMGSTPNRADNRVKKLIVGDGITVLCSYAFEACQQLTQIVFPQTLETIENKAFYGDYRLLSVNLEHCKIIGEYAFYNTRITTADLSACKRIEKNAFDNCLYLDTCFFSEELEVLEEYAFNRCRINMIEIPSSITIVKQYTFCYNPISQITFHEGLQQIEDHAFDSANVQTLSFPDSLVKIGSSAFANCTSLTTLALGTGLNSIDTSAFNSCSCLAGEIVFPANLTSVGYYAFNDTAIDSIVIGEKLKYFGQSNMPHLLSITVSENNPYFSSYDGVLYNNDYTKIIQCPTKDAINIPKEFPLQVNTTSDFLGSFTNVKYVNIDEENTAYKSINGIVYSKDGKSLMCCPYAYEGEVNIAEGTEEIKGYAFRYRLLITGVSFPNTLHIIGERAFDNCRGIQSLNIPGSVMEIEAAAFDSCSGVINLTLNEGLTTIKSGAFQNLTSITNVEIPDSVSAIYAGAFSNCTNLVSASLGNGIDAINNTVFYGCSNLLSVALGDNIKSIGSLAFYYCSSLISVTLNNSIEVIENSAFFGCSSLAGEFIIPDSCISVGRNAFSGTAITKLYLGSGVNSYASSTDMNCLEEIVVSPSNQTFASWDGVLYTKDYSQLLQCPVKDRINLPAQWTMQEGNLLGLLEFLTYISVDEKNQSFCSEDGLLYSKDKKTFILCPARYNAVEVTLPEGVERIENGAFSSCTVVQKVFLPDTLEILAQNAFTNCSSLREINIPDSVTTIEMSPNNNSSTGCFSKCKNLNTVVLGNGLTTLPDKTFSDCTNLRNVTFGDNIAHIIGKPFYHSGIVNVTLSKSLQEWSFDSNTIFTFASLVVPNRYTEFENIQFLRSPDGIITFHPYGVYPKDGTISGFCGSPAHEMALKRLYDWNSLGHTYLDWYVTEPATFDHDGLEKRDCAYCGESETRVIPKLERETFTATFVADGRVVASVDFQKGATSIDEPAVPARDRYIGAWEPYTLNDEDLTINAVYTLIKSDDAEEIETESTIEHYTEKDNVLFRVKATSAAKIVKSIVSQSIPLDIVLVVDQSGSMDDVLGGSVKKVDALKDAANSFIASVAENARLTGAAHRIGIVGFGLAGSYSGYQTNENSELLTGTNGVVNYSDVTPADYASALLPVLDGNATNAALTDAVAAIEARGATAADLGLEMAKGVFANTDSTGRDRVVIFMTDGEPTYTNGFQTQVANNAVYNSYLLKNAYDALVYSVGIFGTSESENRKIKSFMNAVSSNYPNAKTYMNLGAAVSDAFSITASHTDALSGVFRTITTESLSHTAAFDNVTLIKTLSPYVTLTAPQEETLRIDAIRKYGISNDQITVTRDEQGRTQIRIDGLTPYEVTDDEGNVSYEVAIEFFASLNENAAAAGTYAVDTDDSGIMLGDNAIGYEAAFGTNELTLSAQKTRYIFTINGEVYEIAEGSTVAAAVPETDFAADWQFSGWNTSGVSNANGTIIDATLVKAPRTVTWHTADGDVQQIYTEGQFLTPPEVADRADGSKFLSWDKSLPTVMLDQDLEFTAVYGPHIHRYTSELTTKATCTTDGLLTYTCMCGDVYTEPVAAIGHNYEAITATGDSDPNRCTFVCTNCGDRYDYALNYKVEERTYYGSRTLYEFALTDDDLETGMQPDGSIDVRVPLNEFQGTARNVKVRRFVNGVWENVPAKIEDGYLVITADHFTPYEVQFTFDCNETGNHSWDSGTVTKEATCKEQGEITCTCETCEGTNVVYTGLNSDNHVNYGSHIENTKTATCKEEGYTGDTVCNGCGATLQTGESISKDKKNHADYDSHIENARKATCKEDGYTGDTVCDGCGATLQEGMMISKGTVQHALTHFEAKAATTEAEGNVEYYHCSVCEKNFSDANGTKELTKVTTDKLQKQEEATTEKPKDEKPQKDYSACKYCGEPHTGAFGWLVKIIHSILALFGLRK